MWFILSFGHQIGKCMKKAWISLMLILFVATIFSCKTLRKKNRCNTCPTWDHIDVKR